jgi:phospholipid/cholesterol/gamma-HCH transport system substrate-binding protein
VSAVLPALDDRRQHILTGAIAIVLVVAAITVGVKGAFGAFEGGYELAGTFDAAGQGLLSGSDVKVRGVNVGEVERIELVDGAAEITLRIDDGEPIPEGSSATIRPKTLFGEKFVDIDTSDAAPGAPLLQDGDRITNTQGGFELERVLADTFPVLQAVDPNELMTVVSELATGADGLGDEVNRTLVNGAELSEVFADNAANTEQLLEDLALLSDELAGQADSLVGLAEAANVVLPTINEHEDDLVALLEQTGRLSNDVADLLEANREFVRASMVEGSRTLQLLYDERTQVIPLVRGLRQYVETLTSVIRLDVGDGTQMAAVKGILGGQACAVLACAGAEAEESAGATAAPPPSAAPAVGLEALLEALQGLDLSLGSSAPASGSTQPPAADEGAGLGGLLEKVLVG